MSARTESAFSALIGLDPLGGVSPGNPADPIDTDIEARIARIVATPRHGTMTNPPARRAPQWTGAAPRRRVRYGAIGLVASAAIAVITRHFSLPAILVLALIWSLLHVQYDWFGTAQVFLIGVLFGFVRWRSGSTTLVILLHMLLNLESVVETVIVMGWV